MSHVQVLYGWWGDVRPMTWCEVPGPASGPRSSRASTGGWTSPWSGGWRGVGRATQVGGRGASSSGHHPLRPPPLQGWGTGSHRHSYCRSLWTGTAYRHLGLQCTMVTDRHINMGVWKQSLQQTYYIYQVMLIYMLLTFNKNTKHASTMQLLCLLLNKFFFFKLRTEL